MVEALATAAFLVALTAALVAVGAFLARAEQRERRAKDTDHDL